MLTSLDESALFYGATALTTITDNAALTYLGSLVEGVSDDYKYALVAGAVAGGGLTVIANAPNPPASRFLRTISKTNRSTPLGLLAAALPPTLVVIFCFRDIRGQVGELFDPQVWVWWFSEVERPLLFLIILPFVIGIAGLWAELRDRRKKQMRTSPPRALTHLSGAVQPMTTHRAAQPSAPMAATREYDVDMQTTEPQNAERDTRVEQ